LKVKIATRKINKVGDSLLVTLPKDFCKELGLKPNDYMEIIFDGQIFILRPAKIIAEEKLREIKEVLIKM